MSTHQDPTPSAPSLQSVVEGAANEQAKFVESMCNKLGGVGLVSCFKGILTRHFAPLLTAREAETRDWIKWHGELQEKWQDAQAQIDERDERIGRLEMELDLARKLFAQRDAELTDTLNECVPIEAERNALRTRCEELEAALKPFAEMAKYRDFPFHGQMQAMQVNPSTAAEPGFQLFYADFYRAADTLDKRAARKEGQQAHEKGEGA